ncbi:MAG: hypothetical protein ABIS59_01130 [Candidatus Saccharibacteria bacterium]
MIVAAMATMPSRIEFLEQVVGRIRPQVDVLRIYLNNFDAIPAFLQPGEGILSEDAVGDLGDAGKFYWIAGSKNLDWDHYLTIDDDIGYPEDYVSTLVRECELRDGKAILGVHGSRFSPVIHDFVTSRSIRFRFHEELLTAQSVHILGTGTTFFHRGTLNLSLFDFRLRNAGDVQLAIIAQNMNVPLVAIPRPENWLVELRPWTAPGFSIWKETKATTHTLIQTHLCNTVASWIAHKDPANFAVAVQQRLY